MCSKILVLLFTEEPCALYCMNEEFTYTKLENNAKDGTRCKTGTKNMCVAGSCMVISHFNYRIININHTVFRKLVAISLLTQMQSTTYVDSAKAMELDVNMLKKHTTRKVVMVMLRKYSYFLCSTIKC